MRKLEINANDAGQRLDKFLLKYMSALTKGALYKGLRKDCVKINGKHVKDGAYMLKEGDELKLFFRDEYYGDNGEQATKAAVPKAVKRDFGIVYEDENIVIIDKKRGTVVHADDKGSANTLVEQFIYYLYEKGEYRPDKEHSFKPALCNRLDRNTQGLLIGAKNAAALRIINEKIRNREIHKLYLCRAKGHIPHELHCKGFIERGDKAVRALDSAKEGAKAAELIVRPLRYEGGDTVAEVELLTGRTHQIRAQLSQAGFPLVNDRKYGGGGDGRYELVSYKLVFEFVGEAGVMEYLNGRVFCLTDTLIGVLKNDYDDKAMRDERLKRY